MRILTITTIKARFLKARTLAKRTQKAWVCVPSPVSAEMLSFFEFTGRNVREISKSEGGLWGGQYLIDPLAHVASLRREVLGAWTQPSIS